MKFVTTANLPFFLNWYDIGNNYNKKIWKSFLKIISL